MPTPPAVSSRLTRLIAATLLATACARSAAAQHAASTAAPPEGWSRVPRWQIVLGNGDYLWDLRQPSLRGDTLVARQADTLLSVPLADIDELRLVRPSVKQVGGGAEAGARATFGGLAGADDVVVTLTRYPLAERRRIVGQVLRERAGS